jgi:hypothetical protein
MPIAKIKDKIDRLKTTRAEPPTPDERDAVIAALERRLTAARDDAAELRRSIGELYFQNDTLETSYSKQLNDAREQQAAAEAALATLQVELDEIGGGEAILAVLAAARADLQRITAERDRLRGRIRQPVRGQRSADVPEPTDAVAEIDAYSIDELLEDAVWAREQARINKERVGATASLRVIDEAPEDMVAPDAVFPNKAADSSS